MNVEIHEILRDGERWRVAGKRKRKELADGS